MTTIIRKLSEQLTRHQIWNSKCLNFFCLPQFYFLFNRRALLVQLYLRIDRLDLAQKEVKQMKSVDEDNVLTTLATAWVNLETVLDFSTVLFLVMLIDLVYFVSLGWSQNTGSCI